jgi:hypothetical protein
MSDDFPTGQYNLEWICYGPNPCDRCQMMEHTIFEPGTEITLPLHDHCECRYIPIPEDPTTDQIDWSLITGALRLAWIAYVAWLIRNAKPIPPILAPLQDEAEEYNQSHPHEEDPPMPNDPNESSAPPVGAPRPSAARVAPSSDAPPGSTVTLSAPLLLTGRTGRREYAVRFIRAGRVVQADGTPGDINIPPEPIESAVAAGMFTGLACFVDHPDWFEDHSLRNLAAVSIASEWNAEDQSADGAVRLYETEPGRIVADLFDGILQDRAAGDPIPNVGMSLVFYPRWRPRDNYDQPRELAAFRKILSADFVFTPAADGRVKEALEALSALGPTGGHQVAQNGPNELGQPADEIGTGSGPNAPITLSQSQEVTMPPNESQETPPASPPASVPAAPSPTAEDWLRSLAQTATEALIANSGLPAPLQQQLRSQSFTTPDQVTRAIEAQRQLLASLQEDRHPDRQRPAPVHRDLDRPNRYGTAHRRPRRPRRRPATALRRTASHRSARTLSHPVRRLRDARSVPARAHLHGQRQ